MIRFPLLSAILSVIIVTSCQSSATSNKEEDTAAKTNAATPSFKVDTLFSGFQNPWGMAWLPDGRMLITEKSGQILIFKDGKNTGEKLSGVPAVADGGQGGLLDIKLHPDYEKK